MKVVLVPHGYAPSIGGAQAYTRGLAEGLARLGHEVHVVAPDVADPEAFYETGHPAVGVEQEVIGGVGVHRIPYRSGLYRSGLTGRRSPMALRSSRRRYARHLADSIASLGPDVVVTLPHLFPNVEEALALRRDSSWPVVYAPMLHEHDPYWSIERVAEATSAADGVVALTDHERGRLLESYGAAQESTVVIPPGVDVPTAWSTYRSEPTVLVIGRRAASKRLDAVYDAMLTVWKSRPNARLVVAGAPPGRGPDPADPLRGDERVTIVDSVDDDARADLFTTARAVVSASIVESFGLTTLEAWAHGTPVVVADTPVARSVVRDGVDGVVAGPDAEGLAAGIERVLTDPFEAGRMGGAGRARAEQEFAWDRSVEKLEGLLERVGSGPT